jgi:hypothetical protein
MSNGWRIFGARMQNTAQTKPHLWPPGVSGNPAGSLTKAARRERVHKIVEAWAAPFMS